MPAELACLSLGIKKIFFTTKSTATVKEYCHKATNASAKKFRVLIFNIIA